MTVQSSDEDHCDVVDERGRKHDAEHRQEDGVGLNRRIAPFQRRQELIDGDQVECCGEQPDHHERKPRVEDRPERHSADGDCHLPTLVAPPRQDLSRQEAHVVLDDQRSAEEQEGTRESLADDLGDRTRILTPCEPEVASEEVTHVGEESLSEGSVQPQSLDGLGDRLRRKIGVRPQLIRDVPRKPFE